MIKITIAAVATVLAMGGSAIAVEPCDAERGKRVFANTCQICHSVERGGGHIVGPNLNGVVGRALGKATGFDYSSDLASAKAKWEGGRLDRFLDAPQEMFPGTSMAFAGLKIAEDRRAVVCYLAGQSAPATTSKGDPAFDDIRKRLKEVERLWAARDALGVSRLLYADDVLVMGQGEKDMVRGRAAADSLVKTLVAGAAKVEITLVDGRAQGKDGVVTWIQWHVVPITASEKPFDVMSLYAWRREAAGWRVVSDMYLLQ